MLFEAMLKIDSFNSFKFNFWWELCYQSWKCDVTVSSLEVWRCHLLISSLLHDRKIWVTELSFSIFSLNSNLPSQIWRKMCTHEVDDMPNDLAVVGSNPTLDSRSFSFSLCPPGNSPFLCHSLLSVMWPLTSLMWIFNISMVIETMCG